MSKAVLKTTCEDLLDRLLAKNQLEVGRYFRKLYRTPLSEGEERVLALLARSRAYAANEPAKLLELAKDLRAAHAAQIEFVEKYIGELFLPNAIKCEKEEVDFLDTKIIPFLSNLVS